MKKPPAEAQAGGVYSNLQIKSAVAAQHIVILPYEEAHVNGSSYDVTLGYYYYRAETLNERPVYNPFDLEDVERYFDGPYKAMTHEAWAKLNGMKEVAGIPSDHPVIPLKPGERILAHTHEFIGIKAPGTSSLQARSTWGRNGIAICLDAGWGDPGYINRWTMEVYNMNQRETVLIPVGERVAQMVFFNTGEVQSKYSELSGKYQQNDDLDKLVRTWSPDQMIPKAYKDTRQLPTPIEGAIYD